jgi:hypothetical protein
VSNLASGVLASGVLASVYVGSRSLVLGFWARVFGVGFSVGPALLSRGRVKVSCVALEQSCEGLGPCSPAVLRISESILLFDLLGSIAYRVNEFNDVLSPTLR